MGFPPAFFTVLFAIPRITGYLAHWRESLDDPDTKILRPHQDYRVRRTQADPPATWLWVHGVPVDTRWVGQISVFFTP